jgi:hypothetical protein
VDRSRELADYPTDLLEDRTARLADTGGDEGPEAVRVPDLEEQEVRQEQVRNRQGVGRGPPVAKKNGSSCSAARNSPPPLTARFWRVFPWARMPFGGNRAAGIPRAVTSWTPLPSGGPKVTRMLMSSVGLICAKVAILNS